MLFCFVIMVYCIFGDVLRGNTGCFMWGPGECVRKGFACGANHTIGNLSGGYGILISW